MDESSEYRSEILYLEKQKLITACLANAKYHLLYLLNDDQVAIDAAECADANAADDLKQLMLRRIDRLNNALRYKQ
jgi:hypothetical protein